MPRRTFIGINVGKRRTLKKRVRKSLQLASRHYKRDLDAHDLCMWQALYFNRPVAQGGHATDKD